MKYGRLPSSWGDVKPTQEWREKLFRSETVDHASPEGNGGEHLIVNVWRPIKKVMQWPLALLDARSLVQDDVHPTVLQTFDNTPGGQAGMDDKKQDLEESRVVDEYGEKVHLRKGEVLTPLHDPKHRWVVFPDMEIDEVLLLKIFDSRKEEGLARFGCHSAIFDPTRDLGSSAARGIPNPQDFAATVTRESIEVRCLVILPRTKSRL